MELYAGGSAVEIHYPAGEPDAQYAAAELARRLDDLASDASSPFTDNLREGTPTTDVEAIFVGTADAWTVPWWVDENDFGIKVVSGGDRINGLCTGEELHIIARDTSMLLRAIWITLHHLGWRHYMPNGVAGQEDLWIDTRARDLIRIRGDRVWTGAVDHLDRNIAGATSNLGWSDGTDHGDSAHPNGLQEGDLKGAIGGRPLVESSPQDTWLRHMGWTSSSSLQTNAAWPGVIRYSNDHELGLTLWDPATGVGHYTEQNKLYTDDSLVRDVALAYANDKVTVGLDWVSLSRPDGEANWDIDFGDPAIFGAKAPVRRQIELANFVATSNSYTGIGGIVIQAYGDCAETPTDDVWPDPSRVCVIVVEAYRPPGKTVEQIIADYMEERVDGAGNSYTVPRCPLGLYQYLYSSAWGQGIITAKAGSPALLVESANRVRALPIVRPKVLTGEAMTGFGLYGLGYYCYMRMILQVGCIDRDFTQADFEEYSKEFLRDMFPTTAVRTAVRGWYALLLDLDHKPLLSEHLVRCLWDQLTDAMAATMAGSREEERVAELCKYTRYLDLRNRYEAAEAAGLSSEDAYDKLMEWLFRIRDSGLVDVYSLFEVPLDEAHHAALGLGSIFDALNDPPAGWVMTPPLVDDFKDPETNWITDGLNLNAKHTLTDTSFSTELIPGGFTDSRPPQADVALLPYIAQGKMRLWLVPTSTTFECRYKISGGPAYVEFINQETDVVDWAFAVDSTTDQQEDATLVQDQLYEIRLTNYAASDQLWLDWSGLAQAHYLSFDPGREGDPCGFQAKRSFYFLVPDGVTEIHFYASNADELQLFVPDGAGGEVEDTTFNPVSRAYQSHGVSGVGRRVLRIAGLHQNDPGFWLLNCPNLFALHPNELLIPSDA